MQRDRKKPLGPMIQLIKYLFNNINQLSENQRKKCREKFQSFKALGSTVISKNQLNKVLIDYGKKASQEELLQMIQQADPNGYGYVSYEAFEKLIQYHKQKNNNKPLKISNQLLKTYYKPRKKIKILTISLEFLGNSCRNI